MNVGIYIGDVEEGKGGEFTFQDSIISALEKTDTRHDIFVFHYGKRYGVESVGKVTYVQLRHNRKFSRLLKRIFNHLTGRKINTSLLQLTVNRYCIDMMWFPSLNFVSLDLPYICTVLDLEHRVHPFFPEVGIEETWKWRERLYTSMLPRAAYIVTGTEAGKREIVNFYSPDAERVRVVPFPATPFALDEMEIPATVVKKYGINKPYLFYPAQFWPHKNHIALLRALTLLRDRDSLDIEVVFCGSDKGNLAHVRQMARELGVESHVRFLGFVTREELYVLYRNAFALVYPSMFGPDNLPPLEAFAIGCPVIAAHVSGAVEQMDDASLLFDPRHEEEIASAVLRLHKEPALRKTLVEKGKGRASRWTAYDYVQEIMAIYDEFELYRRCWSREKKYANQ